MDFFDLLIKKFINVFYSFVKIFTLSEKVILNTPENQN
ncbi:hypothetical protein ASZ90_005632 [hydrocarbon metagenome]|uniref:Uncharacterized protein n=1 Tax=hydrocarbon metagenome TaxID=938273 RepID=A0A0W8FUC8_9ZZZZ